MFIKKLDSYLLREIGLLSRAIQYIADVKYKELKLQKGQFTFLTRICENPGISFIDLSNMLKVDKTTTSKAVQKLIDAEYIYKKIDNKDKRSYNLMPTDKALEIYDYIIEEENLNLGICFKGLSEEEKEIAMTLVEKMSKNLEERWKDVKEINK